jgi:hypothetical protein
MVEKEHIRKLIDQARWTNAKTYEAFAPHEYIINIKYPELHEELRRIVETEGKEEEFRIFKTVKKYRYWRDRDHKYWVMGEVANRARIKEDGT